ncbi:MAG: hypothetical protein D3905_03700 [Candidatus Electrothrix sp. AS4_5]|nr:hypothetical protein [Candidatus Electrothrix gigas]
MKRILVERDADEWKKPLVDAIKKYIIDNYLEEVSCRPFTPKKCLGDIVFKKKYAYQFFCALKVLIKHFLYLRLELANAEIDGVAIGRYVVATVMRHPKAAKSSSFALFRKPKIILIAACYYAVAEITSKDIEYSYLNDSSYLYGIVNDVLLKNGVKVFRQGYPYCLVECDKGCKRQIDPLRLRLNRAGFSYKKAEEYVNARLENPQKNIGYFQIEETLINNFAVEKRKKVAVVYTHSFTDAQLVYGYDGFESVYFWLIFTVEKLIDQGYFVLLKGHPNFWAPDYQSKVVAWDKDVWLSVLKYVKKMDLVQVIDFPLYNGTLLGLLDKSETLLVSHHGNAIIEGAAKKFKTVSSVCSLWGDFYCFGESWRTKSEYNRLLEKPLQEFACNPEEALRFVYDNYMNPLGYHGPFYWKRLIAPKLGVEEAELERFPSLIIPSQIRCYDDVVKNITKGIVRFSDFGSSS